MGRSDGRILRSTQIVNSGSPQRRWNLVILGDGFQEPEMAQFQTAASNFALALMGFSPFSELRHGINVFRVDVASTDSGADDPTGSGGGTGAMVRTFFDATFGSGGLRRGLVVNNGLAWEVARDQVPQAHVVLVVVNSTIWGGSGGSVYTCSLATDAHLIAIHEIGHAFGLGDEYESLIGCDSGETDRNVHGFTFFDLVEPNLTVHEELSTLNTHKWGRFVSRLAPWPTTSNADCSRCDPQPNPFPPGNVGLFEGAHYYHCDAYRPEFVCIMRNNRTAGSFCRACREHIRSRLEPFTFTRVEDLLQWQLVLISRGSGKALDVRAASGANGALVQVYRYTGGRNQRWRLTSVAPGEFRLTSIHSGKVLEVAEVSHDSGAAIQQWDWWSGANQRWRIEDVGEGFCRLVSVNSGHCLDVRGRSGSSGVECIQQQWHGGPNQQWRFSTQAMSIFARHSGKVLDVRNASHDNGAIIQQWDRHGGPNQQWRLEDVGQGYVRIISYLSNKVLDVSGNSRDNGAAIHLWDWHGGSNQQWRLERVGNDFRIVSRRSGLCLDVSGASLDSGTPFIQWNWHGGQHQLFSLQAS